MAEERKRKRREPPHPTKPKRGVKRQPGSIERFKGAWLSNGFNATAAAITIGYSEDTAHQKGYQLLRELKRSGGLADMAERVAEKAELDATRTLREVARILYADPARVLDADGKMLPLDLIDDATRAAIASFELDAEGRPVKIKFWSKVDAMDKAMKHLGLFERDNRQRTESLAIQINLVGAPDAPAPPRDINVKATLVEPPKRNGHNGNGSNGSHA